MLVVDAWAIVGRLAADRPPQAHAAGKPLHAPHLIDVEFLHVMRRLVARGQLAPARADAVRADFSGLRITRYPHTLLLGRMWELRENITAYDAAFVALAEVLGAPLVTTDARLAAVPATSR